MSDFQRLILIKYFQPRCIIPSIKQFVAKILGSEYTEPYLTDIEKTFETSSPNRPILVLIAEDTDPTLMVKQFAAKKQVVGKLNHLSLGQGQSKKAEILINDGIKNGDWVFLENIHLSVNWMPKLEQIIESLTKEKVHSDVQYASFRNNLHLLFVGFLVYLFFKILLRKFNKIKTTLLISISMLFLLFGSNLLKILIIYSISFLISKQFKGSILNPILTWLLSVVILFINQKTQGFSLEKIYPALSFLDSYKGIFPRWWLTFNISVLRMLSFNMDYYWRCRSPEIRSV